MTSIIKFPEVRKICVVVASRANYARIKSAMRAIQEHPKLELQLIVGASALLERYGNVRKIIESDGFKIDSTVNFILEGSSPLTMAKSTGIGLMELPTIFNMLKPDIVLTIADRFETISTAIASTYMNIPLAHTQGGELTGSIDESVRHAITKLAHIHFPATEKSKQRVITMGEDPDMVFNVGCPAMDLLVDIDLSLDADIFKRAGGAGAILDPNKPYIVVMQHPVTTEYMDAGKQIEETLKAVEKLNMQTFMLWPNIDAGTDDISKRIRIFRETHKSNDKIQFVKNISPEDYARLINNCKCLVGNSSSGIREGSFLGVPVVDIGNRQRMRERCGNVLWSDYNSDMIVDLVETHMRNKLGISNDTFGIGNAGKKIAHVLAKIESVNLQKTFME